MLLPYDHVPVPYLGRARFYGGADEAQHLNEAHGSLLDLLHAAIERHGIYYCCNGNGCVESVPGVPNAIANVSDLSVRVSWDSLDNRQQCSRLCF